MRIPEFRSRPVPSLVLAASIRSVSPEIVSLRTASMYSAGLLDVADQRFRARLPKASASVTASRSPLCAALELGLARTLSAAAA